MVRLNNVDSAAGPDMPPHGLDGTVAYAPLAVFPLPIPSQPSVLPTLSYYTHRTAHIPLIIDKGAASLSFGFATSTVPHHPKSRRTVSKYERKAGKQLLLFGDAVYTEDGARSQAKAPWEGDVLLNFDALVSPA